MFLKLGAIGFGGPAAHLATMEEDVVQRRAWLTREHFLDLIGATHLIPGPNSTEMAMHIGYQRAGWAGLVVAGVSFIGPAFVTTTALAAIYVSYGRVPRAEPLLLGIRAAVLAIILVAGWRLARLAVRDWPQGIVALGVCAASLAGIAPIRSLFLGSALGMLALYWLGRSKGSGPGRTDSHRNGAVGILATAAATTEHWPKALSIAAATAPATPPVALSLLKLAAFFLKVGAVLYGSGYVLVAYLEDELVGEYRWLTESELLEAIAIGQLTPGPILSSATFIGYVVMSQQGASTSGLVGAAVATLAIFFPSFCFVAAVNPLIPRLRTNPWTSTFLDAVNAASMGLMAAVAWKLCSTTIVSWHSASIAIAALLVQLKWSVAPVWLVLGGGSLGLLLWAMR